MSDPLNDRITKLEISLAHVQHLLDQLNQVVTAQSLENQRIERRLAQLQDQITRLKEKPQDTTDPLEEKPPHY